MNETAIDNIETPLEADLTKILNNLDPATQRAVSLEATALLDGKLLPLINARLYADARAYRKITTDAQASIDKIRVAQGGYLQATRDILLVESLVKTLARMRQKDS